MFSSSNSRSARCRRRDVTSASRAVRQARVGGNLYSQTGRPFATPTICIRLAFCMGTSSVPGPGTGSPRRDISPDQRTPGPRPKLRHSNIRVWNIELSISYFLQRFTRLIFRAKNGYHPDISFSTLRPSVHGAWKEERVPFIKGIVKLLGVVYTVVLLWQRYKTTVCYDENKRIFHIVESNGKRYWDRAHVLRLQMELTNNRLKYVGCCAYHINYYYSILTGFFFAYH